MPRSLIPLDSEFLKERLLTQERELMRHLAALEEQLRSFEKSELPAYEAWVRLEFGPTFAELSELAERIRERRILAQRVQELVEGGLHPREALYVASARGDAPAAHEGTEEVEARRQAKREAKREARREKKQEQKKAQAAERPVNPVGLADRRRLTLLYRGLARKLHPDSLTSIATERARDLWLEVQAAYEARNIERLIAVSAWLGDSTEPQATGAPVLSFSERRDGLRRLERSRERLERRLAELGSHPAWKFSSARGSDRRKLRQSAARGLEERLARAQEAIEALEDFIDSIGSPRAPKRGR